MRHRPVLPVTVCHAAGPIIAPNAAMTVMTPIAPHTLNTRSLIFPEDDVITVELGEGRRQIQENGLASFDGDVEVRCRQETGL